MKNILYISLVDWFWIKQRPHHMAEILSRCNNVTYFSRMPWKRNSNFVITDKVGSDDIGKTTIIKNENMKIIRKKGIPKERKFKVIKKINVKLFKNYLLKLDKENNYDVIIITHPSQLHIIPNNFFINKEIVYDCMDDYKCWTGCDKDKIVKSEKYIIEVSDIIVVSSEKLYKNILEYDNKLKSKTVVINNGVDIDNFSVSKLKKINEINIFKDNNKKKVGYVGTISNWFDFELLKNTAEKHQELDFYIIGPIEEGINIDGFKEIKNVIFTGSQPYYSVPNILNKLDIAVMLFKKNDLIEAVNPVKIYEYLAMGKAVVALRYKETEKFGDLIYTYESKEEFENILSLAINDNGNYVDKRIEFARDNSWQARVEKLNELIYKRIGRK
ncbi:glycosyltransferase involved in cell wall biosynthesis [Clostridium acetobutylicum]|uniref:Glycosyltransferase n=1 Tax=Clostridium acetobutylicum (strain ATCC 824 / DSM 792 / JCM 1419 / IAM 19013 / LMG 5710 / NBRC 13948 / NRRL B-527 / VKM B-1787 / 2291 / W) TaxID=272562 RepID=Q97EP2_CLOAB|nr:MULTISPECIES: glycosyltransferase [Clostridium]AAK81006.1 Glycosyltransferase [Clostridium acetobutylicum ATCC 824]ADZ22109.1 Glycosyltransferase [Clostridium acetobutylicum EA 2018]AEI34219.1 glycosyltransferase [Clostridium acetobutylicum DSM 1731]AWV78583.1 glycosyltransferase [Clostridium acetobutylicum]MBC2393443.1 glycosyltransferase family 1 protein [Clostridium acetobutylicum]